MKRFWLIAFMAPGLLCAQEMSLSTAVDKALAANHDLLAKTKHIEFLQAEKKEALTHYFPRIDFAGSYTRLNSPIDLNLDALRGLLISLQTENKLADIDLQMLVSRGYALTDAERTVYASQIESALDSAVPSMNIHFLDQDVWRATLEFVQPIWMGGKIQALNRGADLQYQEGVEEFLISQETVKEETCRIYLTAKLLEDVVTVNKQAEEGIAGHLKQAAGLYNSGLIAKSQLLRAKVAFSEAGKNRKNAEDNLRTARSVLANLVKADDPDALVLTMPLPFPPSASSREQVKSSLLAGNRTLKMLDIKQELVKTKKRGDLAAYLPQIFAFGRYELYKGDLSFMDPHWAVGVGLKLNVFSSGEKYFKLAADEKLRQEVEEKKKDVEDLLGKASDQLYYTADSRKNTIDSFPARLEEAEENLKLAASRFSSGLGISLEVVDANLILEKIRTERAQAIYEYNISWLKIHELSQTLDGFIKELETTR
jgi:outer membrane protein TolC